MNCEEAKLRIGAEPGTTSPELLEHLSACPDCREFRRQMLELDQKIGRALRLDRPVVTPVKHARVTPLRRTRTFVASPRWAIAASVLAAFLVGLAMWAAGSRESLASAVVAHMAEEPYSWNRTDPVATSRLQAVLEKGGVKLDSSIGSVVYANSCWFRGHYVPHLVIRTETGPVTVMILSHEHVSETQRFDEGGYSGMITPATPGSIAVLSRGGKAEIEEPARRVLRALQAQSGSRGS